MASFKTAFHQRELVLDCKVAANYRIGDVVKYNAGTNTITKATTRSSVVNGDYIIAQSDMTMEYGHVPVEHRDYRYSDAVAATAGAATKKVAVFQITDKSDVIFDASGADTTSAE